MPLLPIDARWKRGPQLVLYDTGTGRLQYRPVRHAPNFLTDAPEDDPVLQRFMRTGEVRFVRRVKKIDPFTGNERVLLKVFTRDPKVVPAVSRALESAGHRVWENRIKYTERLLADLKLIPCVPIGDTKIEDVTQYLVDAVALDIEVEPTETGVPDPREAKNRVIVVAIASRDAKKVFALWREGFDIPGEEEAEVHVFDDEADLIRAVVEEIKGRIVMTWNGDGFDIPYLVNRAERLRAAGHDVPVGFARPRDVKRNEGGKEEVFWDGEEFLHLDLMRFYSTKHVSASVFKRAYQVGLHTVALQEVTSALLGHGKLETPTDWGDIPKVAKYCLRDATLLVELAYGRGVAIPVMMALSAASKTGLFRVSRVEVSTLVRNALVWKHNQIGMLLASEEDLKKRSLGIKTAAKVHGKFRGALVLAPTKPVVFDAELFDYASLYPSIIIRKNISYDTLNCPHDECRDNKVPELGYHICKKRRGTLAMVLEEIWNARLHLKRLHRSATDEEEAKRYEALQLGLKVLLNATYGVVGSEKFPLYYPPVAESITAYGRFAIQRAKEIAEELGLEVIYGDTDSVMVQGPEEAKRALVRRVEEEVGLKMDSDGKYRFVIFAGKKNYFAVGYDGKVTIKGLLSKKKNTPPFIREVMKRIQSRLVHVDGPEDLEAAKEEIVAMVQDAVLKLKRHEVPPEALVLSVTLGKAPEEYAVESEPVKAAKILARFTGKSIGKGTIVKYVKGKKGPIPIELFESGAAGPGDVDWDRYIALLEGAASQILDALNLEVRWDGTVSLAAFL